MKNLEALFEDNSEIEKHIQNLRTTINGLHTIYETRPDLRVSILPQLETLEKIKVALMEDFNYCLIEGFLNKNNPDKIKSFSFLASG